MSDWKMQVGHTDRTLQATLLWNLRKTRCDSCGCKWKKLKPKKQKANDDDYIDQGEMLEYYIDEELIEIIWLKEFAAGIALIHEFLTDEWFSEDSIRLIFYAS